MLGALYELGDPKKIRITIRCMEAKYLFNYINNKFIDKDELPALFDITT